MPEYQTKFILRGSLVRPDNRFLLVRRALDDSYEPGSWELPGGKRDPDDADELAAMSREVGEETGLQLASTPRPVYTDATEYPTGPFAGNRYDLTVLAARIVDSTVILSHEHQDYAWEDLAAARTYRLTPEIERAFGALTDQAIAEALAS